MPLIYVLPWNPNRLGLDIIVKNYKQNLGVDELVYKNEDVPTVLNKVAIGSHDMRLLTPRVLNRFIYCQL